MSGPNHDGETDTLRLAIASDLSVWRAALRGFKKVPPRLLTVSGARVLPLAALPDEACPALLFALSSPLGEYENAVVNLANRTSLIGKELSELPADRSTIHLTPDAKWATVALLRLELAVLDQTQVWMSIELLDFGVSDTDKAAWRRGDISTFPPLFADDADAELFEL